MKIGLQAAFGFALVASAFSAAPASARHYLQCVPYAREVSGIELHGNAKTWWGQAAGKYERGATPRPGAVLAFAGSGRMRSGHVAMVSKVLNDHEVLLDHANWSRRGGIEHDVRAVDVSDAGDWSRVRVWFAPMGDLGLTRYPTQGFIYPGQAPSHEVAANAPRRSLLSQDVVQLAMLEQ
jgi:surface antigen